MGQPLIDMNTISFDNLIELYNKRFFY